MFSFDATSFDCLLFSVQHRWVVLLYAVFRRSGVLSRTNHTNHCHLLLLLAMCFLRSGLFTRATPASAVLAVERWLAGWLDVCLSHAGILSKRLNPDHLVAPSFRFSLTPVPMPNSKGTPSAGAQNTRVGKFAIFDLNRRLS